MVLTFQDVSVWKRLRGGTGRRLQTFGIRLVYKFACNTCYVPFLYTPILLRAFIIFFNAGNARTNINVELIPTFSQ